MKHVIIVETAIHLFRKQIRSVRNVERFCNLFFYIQATALYGFPSESQQRWGDIRKSVAEPNAFDRVAGQTFVDKVKVSKKWRDIRSQLLNRKF